MHSSSDASVYDKYWAIETDPVIQTRLDRIYENVRKLRKSNDIKRFVFSHGFDGDHGLGISVNQSCVDFILWLVKDYHGLVHLFRCGAKGGDQVERVAQRLYGNGFFKDLDKYIGKDFLFVESLPTADSVADPRGDIHYAETHNLFPMSKKGYIGAAVLRTQRNSPWNDVVPSETVTGHPMETIFFDNGSSSSRKKIELMVESGRIAYGKLFKRMKTEKNNRDKVSGNAKTLSADISVPVLTQDRGIVMNTFELLFPDPSAYNQLIWCMNRTFQYLVDLGVPDEKYYNFRDLKKSHIPAWYIDEYFEQGRLNARELEIFDTYRRKKLKLTFSVRDQCQRMANTYLWDDYEMKIFSVVYNLRFTVYDYDEDGNVRQKALYEPDYEGAHSLFDGKTKSLYAPIDIRILEEPEKNNEGVLTGDFIYCVLLLKESASSKFGNPDISEESVKKEVKEQKAREKERKKRDRVTVAKIKEKRDLTERVQKTEALKKKTKKHLEEQRASEKRETVGDLDAYYGTIDIFSDPLLPRTLTNMITFSDDKLAEYWAVSLKLNHTSEDTIRPIYEIVKADPTWYENLEGFKITDRIERQTFTGKILKMETTQVVIFVSSTVNKYRFIFDYLLDRMHNKGRGYNEIVPSTYENIPDDAYNIFQLNLEEQKQKLRYECYGSLLEMELKVMISCTENASYLVVSIHNLKTKQYLKTAPVTGQVGRHEVLNARWEGIYSISVCTVGNNFYYYYRQTKSDDINSIHEIPYYIWVDGIANRDNTHDMFLLDQFQHVNFLRDLNKSAIGKDYKLRIKPNKFDGYGGLSMSTALAESASKKDHTFVKKDIDQIKLETTPGLDSDVADLTIKTSFGQYDIEVDTSDSSSPWVKIYGNKFTPDLRSLTDRRYTLNYDRDEDEKKTIHETKDFQIFNYVQSKDRAQWWFAQMQCKLKDKLWSPPQVLSDTQQWEFLGTYPDTFDKIKKIMKVDGRHWFEDGELFFESNKTRQNQVRKDFWGFLKLCSLTTTHEHGLKSQIGLQMFELKDFGMFKKKFLTPKPRSGNHIVDFESLAPKAKVFVRLCSCIWVSLLSLYLQSDLFIKLNRNQMWLLDNIFTKCPDFKGFVTYVDRLVSSDAVKVLIPEDSSFPEIVETWEFDDQGILRKVTLKCATTKITEQIKAINQILWSKFQYYKDTTLHQTICFNATFGFIDAVAKHAKGISKLKTYTRPSMSASGGSTVTYFSYSKSAENSEEYDFSTAPKKQTFEVSGHATLLKNLSDSITEFGCYVALSKLVKSKNVDTYATFPVPIMYNVWSMVWLEMLMKMHAVKIETEVRYIKGTFDNDVESILLYHAGTFNARVEVYNILHRHRIIDLNGDLRFMNKLEFKAAVTRQLKMQELETDKWKRSGEKYAHERWEIDQWNYSMLPQALARVKRAILDLITKRTFSWKLSWGSAIAKCAHAVYPDDADLAKYYYDTAIETSEKWINSKYQSIENNIMIRKNESILEALNFDFGGAEIASTLNKIIKELTTKAYEKQFEYVRTIKSTSDELSGAYNSIDVHKLKVKMDQRLAQDPPLINRALPPYVRRFQFELSSKYFIDQFQTGDADETESVVHFPSRFPEPTRQTNKFELLRGIEEEDEEQEEKEENSGVPKPVLDVSNLETSEIQWKDEADIVAIARDMEIEQFLKRKKFCPLINDRYNSSPLPTDDLLQIGLARLKNACSRVSTRVLISTELVEYKICDGVMYDKRQIAPQHECVFFIVRPVLLKNKKRTRSDYYVLLQYMKIPRETLHIFVMSEDYDAETMWEYKTLCMIFFRISDENQVNIVQLNEFRKAKGEVIKSEIVMLWAIELFAGVYFGEPLWTIDLINEEIKKVTDTILYWNCVEYKLSLSLAPSATSGGIGTEFRYSFKQPGTFLSIENVNDAILQLNTDQMIVGIATALNLDVELFAPYQDRRYTIDEQSDDSKIYCLALDNSYHLSYGSQMSFYRVKDKLYAQPSFISDKISKRSEDLIAEYRTNKSQKVVKNKLPLYFITYERDEESILTNIYENQSCFEKSSDGSFFKALAANGYFYDDKMALNEFYLCMVSYMDDLFTFDDMHKAPDFLQARVDELFLMFEEGFELDAKYEKLASRSPNIPQKEIESKRNVDRQNILEEFQTLSASEVFMIYWHILRDPSFAPLPEELTILCKKLNTAIVVFKDDVSVEFGNISNSAQDKYIPPDYHNDVITLLYQPKTSVYSRLVHLKNRIPLMHSIYVGHEVTELHLSTVSIIGEKFTGKYISIHSFEDSKSTDLENISLKSISIREKVDIFVLDTLEYFLWEFANSWYIGNIGQIQSLLNVLIDDASRGLTNGLKYTLKLNQTKDPRGEHTWVPHPGEKNTQKTISVTDVFTSSANGSDIANTGADKEGEYSIDNVMEDIPVTNKKISTGTKIDRLPVYMQYIPTDENEYTVSEKSVFYSKSEQVYNPMILWSASAKNTDKDEDFQKLSDTIVQFQVEEDTSKTDENPFETMKARRARELREQISRQRRGDFGPSWTDDEADAIGGRGNNRGTGGGRSMGNSIRDSGVVLMGGSSEGTGVGGGWSKKGGGGGGGGGSGKKGKARQGTHGSKRVCINRKNGREAREEEMNREGDEKTTQHSYSYGDDYDEPIRGNKSWRKSRYRGPIDSQFFIGAKDEPPHLNNQDGMIVDQDEKTNFMLTGAMSEIILTFEMFGQNDTAEIKIIPGLERKSRILALFVSCFFKVSTYVDMFDAFTVNITVAGKGLLKDMVVECQAVRLLENASDLTDEQFDILDKQIDFLWKRRCRYFNPGEDEMSLEELKTDVEDKSAKLWWAYHRCLNIAAMAFLEWTQMGLIKPSKYITKREALLANRIMNTHENRETNMAILENIKKTQYGQQLKPLLNFFTLTPPLHGPGPSLNPGPVVSTRDQFGIHALMKKLIDAEQRLKLM